MAVLYGTTIEYGTTRHYYRITFNFALDMLYCMITAVAVIDLVFFVI